MLAPQKPNSETNKKMTNLEQKSITFQEEEPEPEEIGHLALKIDKLEDGQFYLQPNYDEGASPSDANFSGKNIIQLGTRLAKYLGSKSIRTYKPLLSIKCNGFSRDEKGLIKSIFDLYRSSRD